MKYVVVKKIFGFDKLSQEKYVVQQVLNETLTFDKVCAQASQICGIHRGTIKQVMDVVIDVTINNLDMGNAVELGELGKFKPGIRSKAKDSAEEANADTIYRKKINFIPGKLLKEMLKTIKVKKFNMPDVDYTDGVNGNTGNTGGNDSGNTGGGGGDWEDPTA